jgi:hypothetical protein
MPPVQSREFRSRWAGLKLPTFSVLLAVGGVVMIAGTFAPWLQSGRVTRDSYRTAGLFQRLLEVDGAAGTALDAMPLFAVSCALCAVIFAVGWRRAAAVLLGLLAVTMALLSGAALLAPGSRDVRVVLWGPVVTLSGAALAVTSAVASVVIIRADKRYRQSSLDRLE